MASVQKTDSLDDWSPPLPEAERMRGLEVEEVYAPNQIAFMKKLFLASSNHGHNGQKEKTRIKKMQNRSANNARSSAHSFSLEDAKLDSQSSNKVKKRVLSKKDIERPVVKEFIHVSKHLDDDFVELLLKEAQYRARIPEFLEILEEADDPPAKYETSPRSVKLPEFIQTEWVDKGFKPSEIDRQMLKAYDEKLVRAIENYEYNNGLLDHDLRFKKVGNKRSRKEMTLSHG